MYPVFLLFFSLESELHGDAKNLGSQCTNAKQKQTEIWRKRRSFILCQAKGKHSQLAPQELCPPSLGNKGKVI